MTTSQESDDNDHLRRDPAFINASKMPLGAIRDELKALGINSKDESQEVLAAVLASKSGKPGKRSMKLVAEASKA